MRIHNKSSSNLNDWIQNTNTMKLSQSSEKISPIRRQITIINNNYEPLNNIVNNKKEKKNCNI